MLGILGNFDFTELLVVAAAAIVIFGKRLPEVAVRAAAQVARLRRTLSATWREAGLDEELRRVRREIERDLDPERSPRRRAGEYAAELRRRVEAPAGTERGGGVSPPPPASAEPSPAGEPEPGGAPSSAREGGADPAGDRESA